MKRKTIQVSRCTQLISLPRKWIINNNVKKGTELDVDEEDNKIIVSLDKIEIKKKEIDLRDYNERMIRWVISAFYKLGYDEIIVQYNNEKQLEIIQNLIKNITPGFNLVIQKKRCIIKSLVKENIEELEETLRKAFLITISMGNNIIEAIKNNQFNALKNIRDIEEINNQLTNYYERLINIRHVRNANLRYVIAWNLEKIADKYKEICDKKIDRIRELEDINRILEGFYQLYLNFDMNKLQKLEGLKARFKAQDPILMALISIVYDFSTTLIMLNDN